MISNSIFNILTGGSSFVGSAIIGLIGKAINNGKDKHVAMMDIFNALAKSPKTEEDKKRAHELALKQLEWHHQSEKMTYQDIHNARSMQSRFVGVTRRVIAWAIIPFFLAAMVVLALYSVYSHYPALSVPVTTTSSFLFGLIKSENTVIKQVHGLLIPGWFPTLMFMVCGFYFGRESIK